MNSTSLILFGIKHNSKVFVFNILFMFLGGFISNRFKNRSNFCNELQFEVVLQMLILMNAYNTKIDELSNHHPSILREYCFNLFDLSIIKQYSNIRSGKDLIQYIDRIGTISMSEIQLHFGQYIYNALLLSESAKQMYSILNNLMIKHRLRNTSDVVDDG